MVGRIILDRSREFMIVCDMHVSINMHFAWSCCTMKSPYKDPFMICTLHVYIYRVHACMQLVHACTQRVAYKTIYYTPKMHADTSLYD